MEVIEQQFNAEELAIIRTALKFYCNHWNDAIKMKRIESPLRSQAHWMSQSEKEIVSAVWEKTKFYQKLLRKRKEV